MHSGNAYLYLQGTGRDKSSSTEYGFNPLHPNISIHSLYTLLYTFPLVLTMRICLAIKASLVGDHLLDSYDLIEGFSCMTVKTN